jgi:acetylglutamate kinase
LLKIFKIGGSIIEDELILDQFLKVFAQIPSPKILIHGGGKMASELSKQLNLEVKMKDGRRITDADTLKVTVMTYAGWINKNIVAKLADLNINSIGLTGADGNLILAHKRKHATIDYGFVGDVDSVNTQLLQQLLSLDLLPVIAPITHDGNGQLLNTNADTIATEVAVATAKSELVELFYLFDLPGLMANVEDLNSLIPTIKTNEIEALEQANIISAGMIPKVHNACQAIKNGVQKITFTNVEGLVKIKNGEVAGTQITL